MFRTSLLIALLISCAALIGALLQYLTAQQLREELAVRSIESRQMAAHIEQLESNLQSAGLQMSNLSAIAQEATARAAQCEAPGE